MFSLFRVFKIFSLIFIVLFSISCSSDGGTDSASSDTSSAVVKLKSIESLSGPRLEAGRQIEIRVSIHASKDESAFPLSYYLVDAASDADENVTKDGSVQIFIGGTSFDLTSGDGNYDVNFTIPPDVATDDFKLMALVELNELKVTDINESIEEFSDNNSIVDDEITSISANDGKADVEVESVAINENEEDIADDDNISQSPSRAMANNLSNPLVNFEVATLNNSIILNDDNVSFHGTVTLKSFIAPANNVTLSACIDTGSSNCTPLEFYSMDDDNNSVLLNNFTIDTVDTNETTDVVFDVIVKKDLLKQIAIGVLSSSSPTIPKLKLIISGVDESATQDFLKNTIEQAIEFKPVLLSSENRDSLNDIVSQIENNASLPDYNLTASGINYFTAMAILGQTTLPSLASSHSGSKKLFSKSFKKSKYGKKFGAGVYLYGKSELNSDGLLARVHGKIKTKVLGKKFTFLGVATDVTVNPGSFEDTGYTVDVTFAGNNLITLSDDLSTVTGMTTSTETEKKKKFKENNTTINVKYTKAQQVGLVSADIDYYIGKSKGYERTIFVSFIPVTVEAEAKGGLGIKAGIGLDGIAKLSANVTPYVDVGAVAEGGVGALGYSAGAGADLTIVKEDFKTTASGEMKFVGDGVEITDIEGSLNENISNVLTGPKGKVYLYAKYRKVKWCKKWYIWYPCGTKKVTKHKKLANFKTKRVKKTLLNKKQTLFKIGL